MLRRSRPLQISLDGQDSQAGVDDGIDRRRGAGSAVDDRHRTRGGVARQPRAAGRHVAAGGQRQDRADQRRRRRAAPCIWPPPNVAGLLAAAGAPLEQSDTVVPAASSPGRRRACRSRSPASGSRRSPSGCRCRRTTSVIDDPTMNMSRQVVEDPGTPGVQDVTFAVATVNGVETGQAASSQCHRHPGPRRGAAGRRQTWYRGASGEQRGDLGRARPM